MRQTIKRAILELGAGTICSLVGFCGTAGFCDLLSRSGLEVDFGGCKSNVFLGLFFGLTMGSLAGILVVNKAIFKMPGWNVQGLIVGFVFGVLMVILGIFGVDRFGTGILFCLPVLVTVASGLGFRMKLFVRQENQKL